MNKCISSHQQCRAPICTGSCFGNGVCVEDNACDCFKGYSGPTCQQECLHKCHARGTCQTNLTCVCDAGFKGSECQFGENEEIPVPTNDCPGYPMCSGKGKCLGHVCHCNLGYSGANCSVHIFADCVGSCRDHGETCILGKCICARGYSGKDCGLVIGCRSKNFCSGNGICVDNTENCVCKPGWEGSDCSIRTSCPESCSTHGVCLGNGTCACDSNFFGSGCDVVRGSCPAQCSGAGQCDENSHTCTCERNFQGPSCAHASLPSVCQRCKHGNCVSGKNGSHCECHHGWGGEHCDKVTACQSLNFCHGRGTCTRNNTCECFNGYVGRECNFILAPCGPEHCNGRGRCVHHPKFNTTTKSLEFFPTCSCDTPFDGPNCEHSKCQVNEGLVCSGHGVCDIHGSEARCSCDAGYVGQDCAEQERPCPGDPVCSGRGSCVDGVCVCNESFDGENCQFKAQLPIPGAGTKSCCPLNCSENGSCVDCICQCNQGWFGEACSTFDGAQD